MYSEGENEILTKQNGRINFESFSMAVPFVDSCAFVPLFVCFTYIIKSFRKIFSQNRMRFISQIYEHRILSILSTALRSMIKFLKVY